MEIKIEFWKNIKWVSAKYMDKLNYILDHDLAMFGRSKAKLARDYVNIPDPLIHLQVMSTRKLHIT